MERSRTAAQIAWLVCGFGFLFVLPAASAQTPTDLSKRATSTIAADHRALAAQYRAHAAEHETDAAVHEALVADLRKRLPDDDAWDLARDATHYAEHSREAAEALRDLAELHEAIADRLAPAESRTTPDAKADEARGCCAKHKADKAKSETTAPSHDHTAK